MSELEKAKRHVYYNTHSEEMLGLCEKTKDLCFAYNHTLPSRRAEREAIIRQVFGSVGENPWIEAPFQCDLGFLSSLGDNVYINHNCVFLDTGGVHIGNRVLIGPNVGFFTPEHAFDPVLRAQGYEIARTITVEDDVWIGGGVSIMGGVTIGAGSIVGAGSVVTKDIPANVIAVGNPCRVLRVITEEDRRQRGPKDL